VLVLLLVLLSMLLSFVPVQSWLANKGVDYVNRRYGSAIELDALSYQFPNQLVLENIYTPDYRGDTLMYASRAEIGIGAFGKSFIYATSADFEQLKFYYLTHPGDSVENLKYFIRHFSSGEDDPSKPTFEVDIDEIEISDGRFRYENLNCDSCTAFKMHQIYIDASNFELDGKYLTLDAENIRAIDDYSLELKSLTGHYELQPNYMELRDLDFTTPHSDVEGSVVFRYDSLQQMSNFVDEVVMEGELQRSSLRSSEIQHFAPSFPDFEDFKLAGQVQGTVNDLTVKGVDLSAAANTQVQGDFYFRESTRLENLYMEAMGMDLQTIPGDIRFFQSIFSARELPSWITDLGYTSLTGDFKGTLEDFKTDFRLNSQLGQASADVNVTDLRADGRLGYSGTLKLNEFQLGEFSNSQNLGEVYANLLIDGVGLEPSTMNTELSGTISSIVFNDYNYQNIKVDGAISNGEFDGQLSIDDPNLNFSFSGNASFEKDTSSYDFTANIKKADLFALNLSDDTISSFTAQMDINMLAVNYNDWTGDIRIFNTTYENSQNFYFFQDIIVSSQGMGPDNRLSVKSNILNAELKGDYDFDGIGQAVQSQVSRYLKTLEPVPSPQGQNFTFDLDVNNSRVLTEIFLPDLEIEPGTRLDGHYASDSSIFDIEIHSPGFSWKKHRVRTLSLDYKGGSERTTVNFDAGQYLTPADIEIDSISLGNFYYNDTLNYHLDWILRDSVDSRGNVSGFALQEDEQQFLISIYESSFNVGYQSFTVKEGNEFHIDTNGIRIENFVVKNETRSLVVNGNISDNPNQILRVRFLGFDMSLVDYFIRDEALDFDGKLYGEVLLTQILGNPKYAADVNIDSLSMNKSYLGELKISSEWSVKNDTISLLADLARGDLQTFRAQGYYQPDSSGAIDLEISMERYRLESLNPLLEGLVENLRGYASGNVKVSGSTGKPVFEGQISLPKTAMTISFLQVDYNLIESPMISLSPGTISFDSIKLRDTRYSTEGLLSGKITHEHLRDFNIDLNITGEEMLVLNTTAASEDPYYGTAFVGGSINMTGPPDQLRIDANLTSKGNSRFVLPLDDPTEVNESDFVTFVSNEVDTVVNEAVNRLNLNKGVALNFNLNLNQNATLAILIDEGGGNMLEGTGYGDLVLRVQPYGDIEMYGTYTVTDGFYDFALQEGVITRKFEVLRGGTVSWNGDPLDALINLTARYTTRANPSTIVPGYTGGRTLVYVNMMLSGELMNPEIDFEVETPRAPASVQTAVNSRLADLDNEYTQVFALLTLNQFIGDQGVNSGQSGASLTMQGVSTLAETFLNQFTGKTSVSVDYTATPADQVNTDRNELDVGVSRQFFDDRVTINGSVGIPINNQNQNQPNQSQIAGDFEIEYNITEDGRFRAKAFNRAVQSYNSNLGQQNYQQGVGVFYRVDFNEFSQLWRKVWNISVNDKATREEEQ